MNTIKTVGLLTVLTLLLIFGARVLFGEGAVVPALVLSLLMNFGTYWFSDKIALKMTGAKPVSEQDAPEVARIVRGLADRAGLPMPGLFVIPQAAPNAFATGRDPQHAVVAVTAGILDVVNERELRAVLAHELGHVRNRDTLVMAVVASVAGAIAYLAQMAQWSMWFGGRDDNEGGSNPVAMILGIILLPIAAMIVQLAVSRSREYGADDTGAEVSGDPLALASALRKMHSVSRQVPLAVNPSTASLFIVQPLVPGGLSGLFSTHPPIEQRIARLERMAGAELPASL
ncbi:MAG TPA: zinc metalloprotease HtpX [Candidatus Limnocylindria bacterium]|nr:zinc metalloprotease HtpX [Candidatus Limnocylindria bacterium]